MKQRHQENVLLVGIAVVVLLIVYPDKILALLTWKDARALELGLSFLTALGVFIAYYQFSKSQRRQEEIDQSSVSVNIKNDQSAREGVFTIVNYGEVQHDISVAKAILNDGRGESGFEAGNPEYQEVFTGLIKPKQSIDMHFFDLKAENINQYKGAILLKIDGEVITTTKVRYSGGIARRIVDKFPKLHPIEKWVIYEQL